MKDISLREITLPYQRRPYVTTRHKISFWGEESLVGRNNHVFEMEPPGALSSEKDDYPCIPPLPGYRSEQRKKTQSNILVCLLIRLHCIGEPESRCRQVP